MSVLIADDDETILLTLELLLKSEGMTCVTCRSPQEALAAQKRGGFELGRSPASSPSSIHRSTA